MENVYTNRYEVYETRNLKSKTKEDMLFLKKYMYYWEF